MRKQKSGDLFSIQLAPGEFLTGRVILDLEAQGVARGLLTDASRLAFFAGAAFVEVFRQIHPEPAPVLSEPVLPGLFVDWSGFKTRLWKVIGHSPVNPELIDMPEWLVSVGSEIHLVRGEVGARVQLPFEEAEAMYCRPTILAPASMVDLCARYVGRKELASKPELDNPMQWYDLRFSPHRERVYALSSLDPNEPYVSLSAKHRADVRRFFQEGVPSSDYVGCAFCWLPIEPGAKECPHCGSDISGDPGVDVTLDATRTQPRASCKICQRVIFGLASVCPHCRSQQ